MAAAVIGSLPESLNGVYRSALREAFDKVDETAASRSAILPLLNTIPGVITLSHPPIEFLKLLAERYLDDAQDFDYSKSSMMVSIGFVHGALLRTLRRQNAIEVKAGIPNVMSEPADVKIAYTTHVLGRYQLLARVLHEVGEEWDLPPISLYAVSREQMQHTGRMRIRVEPAAGDVKIIASRLIEEADRNVLFAKRHQRIAIDAKLTKTGADFAMALNAGGVFPQNELVFSPIQSDHDLTGGPATVQQFIDKVYPKDDSISAAYANGTFGNKQTVITYSRSVLASFLKHGTTARFSEINHAVSLMVERRPTGIDVLISDPNYSGLQVFEKMVTDKHKRETGDATVDEGVPDGWCLTFASFEVECYLCKSMVHTNLMEYAAKSMPALNVPASPEARKVSELFNGSNAKWGVAMLNLVKCLFLRNLDIMCGVIAHYHPDYNDDVRKDIAIEGRRYFIKDDEDARENQLDDWHEPDPLQAFLPKKKEDTWILV